MKFPIGPRVLIALGTVGGAVAFWRIRSRRRAQEEAEWEAEVVGAIDEGRRAGQPIEAEGTTVGSES